MSNKKNEWAIVGGGILGMTLALRFAEQGKKVTLYEGADEVGGLASVWSLGDLTWDRHYHVILMSDLKLRGVLDELGLSDELEWVETKTGFYTDGRMYSMSNSLEFLSFPPLRMIDKFRLGGTIFYASKLTDWEALEKIYVADWLRRLSGNRTFEKIWLPLLRAKLGESYKQTSASFIWATIQRMYAARRSGLKKEMFGYVRGGYARIFDRFVEVLEEKGVTIKLGHRAEKVKKEDGVFHVSFENGHEDTFERVVLTTAAPIATKLCDDLTHEERTKLNNIEYLGIVCPSVLLKKPLSPYYVTNITESWVPFTAVIEMSALVDKFAELGGNSLVYLPKYVTADDPTARWSDEKVKDVFLDSLMRMHPHITPDDILSFEISRVRYVFALPTLEYSKRLPSMHMSTPGLHVVNSAHILNSTLNVNETMQLAESAAKDILKRSL